jgi:beta-carotene 3-hydroxylase
MIGLYILGGIASFIFMEFVAWSNHKYVMHGFLWIWHKDHHINDQKKVALHEMNHGGFEENDYFFLIYALPAIVLFIVGIYNELWLLLAIAIGISLYGLTYFLIHDVLIHQRIKIPMQRLKKTRYFKALIKAHLAHHRPKNKTDFNNYGLLIFPFRYFKE